MVCSLYTLSYVQHRRLLYVGRWQCSVLFCDDWRWNMLGPSADVKQKRGYDSYDMTVT